MRYKALTSFSGIISMAEGEVRELSDKALIDDLTEAGYITEVKADNVAKPKAKKTTKGKGKKDEN
jgi:hypothetical protein